MSFAGSLYPGEQHKLRLLQWPGVVYRLTSSRWARTADVLDVPTEQSPRQLESGDRTQDEDDVVNSPQRTIPGAFQQPWIDAWRVKQMATLKLTHVHA